MGRTRKRNKILIIILTIIILSFSVAFAYFSESLNINGTTNITPASDSWNIIFDDVVSLKTSGYASGTSNRDSTEKKITFSCEFLAANDSCKLSGSIVNEGTISALYKSSSLNVSTYDGEIQDNNYSDGIISVEFNPPSGWVSGSTVLKTNDKGKFSIKVSLNDVSSIQDSISYTITIKFYFEQSYDN
jgi:hypothetical protein